jgi:hypothetical protein
MRRAIAPFALLFVVLLPAARASKLSAQTAVQTPVALTLSPDSGAAGTVVTISGFVAGVGAADAAAAAAPESTASDVDVCWDLCPGGPTFTYRSVVWSTDDPGAFAVSFTTPAVPWLESDGVHQPTPGSYTVGLQCLTPPGTRLAGGCAIQPADATATFTLTGPAPAACPTAACASLVLMPAEAPPGALVQVSGNAPLTQSIAVPDGPCCWQLVAQGGDARELTLGSLRQSADGSLSGSFRVPLSLASDGAPAAGTYTVSLQTGLSGVDASGEGAVLLSTPSITIVARSTTFADAIVAPTPFTIDAAQTWSALNFGPPALIQPSTPLVGPAVTAAGGDPARVAACVSGAVLLSNDDGANWQQLPTDGADAAISAAGYAPFPTADSRDDGPTCLSATLDPLNPEAVFATFTAASPQYGAPPIVRLGLSSDDGGADWQPVPAPGGASAENFGGFVAGANGVEALFTAPAGRARRAADVLVESSADGGQTWAQSDLSCPSSGPCVRWGAAANSTGSCAMHGYPQPLLVSPDGGASFVAPDWPSGANGCDANELISFDPTTVLLLSGRDPFPLVLSRDGGQSWQAIALPPLPDDAGGPSRYPDLQLLPNGALLAHAATWQLLAAGADAWCGVDSALLPPATVRVDLAAGRLWWYDGAATAPLSVDATDIACTGG